MTETLQELLLLMGIQELELQRSILWQVKCLAVEHVPGLAHLRDNIGSAPVIMAIPMHKTEQFPLPALRIDESNMRKHGLLFVNGNLLTIALLDKVEAARRDDTDFMEALQFTIRRFGIFHAKMAGCRMVVNQHWGMPNTKWAAAHVRDAYRMTSKAANFEEWACQLSSDDFNSISEWVLEDFFSSKVVAREQNRAPEECDHIFENTLLYNRDVILYVEICDAIKMGDIGRVMNIFHVWMVVMMRGNNFMPKYPEAIFETLVRIDSYPDTLREIFLNNWLVNLTGKPQKWKEVDLLQEHHNFWAKVIYTLKV
ncbi:hypothetical protein JB92DRAFT_3161913 [Gautieria morchelliformis]|nr:hypothetical protein JB92DRAFT_3161913 [Gautieria morchelliformis]